MSPCLPAILCAHVVLCPGMPLAARGFQLQNTGMHFAIVSEKAKSRLTPLRASPGSHSRLHMADQPKGTVSSFNSFKDQILSEDEFCKGLKNSGVGLLGAEGL